MGETAYVSIIDRASGAKLNAEKANAFPLAPPPRIIPIKKRTTSCVTIALRLPAIFSVIAVTGIAMQAIFLASVVGETVTGIAVQTIFLAAVCRIIVSRVAMEAVFLAAIFGKAVASIAPYAVFLAVVFAVVIA